MTPWVTILVPLVPFFFARISLAWGFESCLREERWDEIEEGKNEKKKRRGQTSKDTFEAYVIDAIIYENDYEENRERWSGQKRGEMMKNVQM